MAVNITEKNPSKLLVIELRFLRRKQARLSLASLFRKLSRLSLASLFRKLSGFSIDKTL